MSSTVTRTQKIISARGDGRFDAIVRAHCEHGGCREFIAGVGADLDEALALAEALELKLQAVPAN